MTAISPRPTRQPSAAVVLLATAASLCTLVCGGPTEPEPPPPEPIVVESPSQCFRIGAVPVGLVVGTADGPGIALEPADPTTGGRIVVTALPPDAGQNLPAEVRLHQTSIESRDGGDYLGAQELIGPLGTAFISRGSFVTDGEIVEETVIFTLHPNGGRMLTLSYQYPASGDSSVRAQQLVDVLASVEGLEEPPPSD